MEYADDETPGLALRAAALHPKFGSLTDLTPAYRNRVWKGVLQDAIQLYQARPNVHAYIVSFFFFFH